jgi:thioredoxin 2
MSNLTADERGLIVTCPHCHQRNRAAFERLGQNFRCSKCQHDLELIGEPFEIATEATFDAVVKNSALPVLVDFWAPWCGPCKMIAPELAKAAQAVSGKWLVGQVNIDQLPRVAERYQIASIPTMAVFRKGREITRKSGAMGAAAIRQFMDSAGVV